MSMIFQKWNESTKISQEEFEQKTSIVVDAVVSSVVEHVAPDLNEDQIKWFYKHSELRIRKLFIVNPLTRGHLSSADGREWCYALIEHWLKAYVAAPSCYVIRHTESF